MSNLSPTAGRIFSAYLEAVHRADNPASAGGVTDDNEYLDLMLTIAEEARQRYNAKLRSGLTSNRYEMLEQMPRNDMYDAEDAADHDASWNGSHPTGVS